MLNSYGSKFYRFFGIDWERVFGRCFTLSMNVKVFTEQLDSSRQQRLQNDVFSEVSHIKFQGLGHKLNSILLTFPNQRWV